MSLMTLLEFLFFKALTKEIIKYSFFQYDMELWKNAPD